ncbi:MAG: hypothetical protein M1400_00110, partial [Patescibacteria group bacterium]|nr:hypothetical protein [Patescibacteria group bacterium]
VTGRSGYLRGLKENVIIGKLIPAGTGFNASIARENLQLGEGGSSAPSELDGEAELLAVAAPAEPEEKPEEI